MRMLLGYFYYFSIFLKEKYVYLRIDNYICKIIIMIGHNNA